MSHWLCETPGCDHNRSQHRQEWNKFRGVWVTSCRAERFGLSGKETCRCGAFTEKKEQSA